MRAAFLITIALAAVLGLALYVARVLRLGALDVDSDHEPDPHDLEVVARDQHTITIRPAARRVRIQPTEPGLWGIESESGAYDRVGKVISREGGAVVREFMPVQDAIHPGDFIRLDTFAYTQDPRTALDLEFENVQIPTPLGECPAWLVPAHGDTWAILVHGKGANRREALRIMPTLHEAGLPCLAISYRNDAGCPPDPGGYYSYGRTEWEDLEAAAIWALEHSARRLIIVGYSMGGAITMSFMAKSPLRDQVDGLILDAPMLDFTTTVAHGASQAHIPRHFLAISNRVATRRYGLQWAELDYTARTDHLSVPILLFHGDADTTIPVALSDAFAAANPEHVTYVRVPNAGHVRAWNTDQPRYESAVRDFIARTK